MVRKTKGGGSGKRRGGGKRPRAASKRPTSAAAASRAIGWRVPREAPDDIRAVADEALQTITSVMRGGDAGERGARLRAAVRVREEVCGPIVQRIDVAVGGTVYVVDPYTLPPDPADVPLSSPDRLAAREAKAEAMRRARAKDEEGRGVFEGGGPSSAPRGPRRKHKS